MTGVSVRQVIVVSHFLYAKDGSPDIRIYPLKRVNVKKLGAPGHGLHPSQTALKAIFLISLLDKRS